MKILVTGATGYIGGRLVPRLLDLGHDVRVLDPQSRQAHRRGVGCAVEICPGDALDLDDVRRAMVDVDVVYYLVHSIGTGAAFAASDRRGRVERRAPPPPRTGVRRIVYLGGLVPTGEQVSPHLASRAEVGQVFLDGAVAAVVLQAGVIIGSGSASFEMLRYLTERLPGDDHADLGAVTACSPSRCATCCRTSSARSTLPDGTNRRFDLGGPDVLTYEEMMQRYAKVAGLPRG